MPAFAPFLRQFCKLALVLALVSAPSLRGLLAAPLPETASPSMTKPGGPVITDQALPADPLDTLDAAEMEAPTDERPIVYQDDTFLPRAVKLTRDAIMEAARSGDLQAFAQVVAENVTIPAIGFAGATEEESANPVAALRAASGDTEGQEILAIMLEILEAGYVHVDQGTSSEIYLWPYFARYPIYDLTPEQRVDLFRIVTSYDLEQMEQFGAYNFYRLGISPDGIWQFFIAGD